MAFLFAFCLLSIISFVAPSGSKDLFDQNEDVIPGEYVIVLKEDSPVIQSIEGSPEFRSFSGSSITTKSRSVIGRRQFLTVKANAEDIKGFTDNQLVKIIEPNAKIFAYVSTESMASGTPDDSAFTCIPQSITRLWGLDRIDQREPISNINQYIYGYKNDYESAANVYVVDSGVDVNHPEFEGRAVWGYTAPGFDPDADENGHGTHVAGTIGSLTYGVAKQASVIAVKVLDSNGRGSEASIISGLEWVVNDFARRGRRNSVVNLSLGAQVIVQGLDEAVEQVIDEGITVVVAAGNDNADACLASPARVSHAITVGAHDRTDSQTTFSNSGECVDIWAPGQYILSILPDNKIELLSGTSMAAPHVTGTIARLLQTMSTRRPTVAGVSSWLDEMSTKGRLTFIDTRNSPNKMVYIDCEQNWTVRDIDFPEGGSYKIKLSFSLFFLCTSVLFM